MGSGWRVRRIPHELLRALHDGIERRAVVREHQILRERARQRRITHAIDDVRVQVVVRDGARPRVDHADPAIDARTAHRARQRAFEPNIVMRLGVRDKHFAVRRIDRHVE